MLIFCSFLLFISLVLILKHHSRMFYICKRCPLVSLQIHSIHLCSLLTLCSFILILLQDECNCHTSIYLIFIYNIIPIINVEVLMLRWTTFQHFQFVIFLCLLPFSMSFSLSPLCLVYDSLC